MILYKQYVRKSLESFSNTFRTDDQFEYSSVQQFTLAETAGLLRRCQDPRVDPTVDSRTPEETLREIVEHAGNLYSPETWLVAIESGVPVGVVFAQRYWDLPQAGGIFHIGLTPEHRGRGYGKFLLGRGLEELQKSGAKEYIGSTDVGNIAMLRTFQELECRFTQVYKIDFRSAHDQELLEKLPSVQL